jgi:hypothetical protein
VPATRTGRAVDRLHRPLQAVGDRGMRVVLALEVTVRHPSEFESALRVTGEERHGYRILKVESPTIANAIAALVLHIRNTTGKLPYIYFNWTEGNLMVYLLRYQFLGEGEIAPVTREVLREADPDPARRPVVRVG